MSHNEQNISGYHAGDALDIVTTVEDDIGDPVDISGATDIEYYIKDAATDADIDAHVTKTLSDGVSITDGAAGEFTVEIDTGDTDGLSGEYHHRARVTDTDGDRSTVFTGTISIDD